MISEFVSSTYRNCDSISQIVNNANIFESNSYQIPSLVSFINTTVDNYSRASQESIRRDVIKLTLGGINWKKIRKDLENKGRNSISVFKPIVVPKINPPHLSLNGLENMKSIDTIEEASVYIHYRDIISKELKEFPSKVSEFEESYVNIRRKLLQKSRKLLKNLIKEHKRYVYYRDKGFIKVENINYFKSQERFIKENLNNLIKCQ